MKTKADIVTNWLPRYTGTPTREFLFVVAPLRVRGGTGSPVNPIAVF